MNKIRKQLTQILVVAIWMSLMISTTTQAAVTSSKPRLDKTKLTLYVGEKVALSVKQTKKAVKWSSERHTIATVSSKGVVTGKKKGTTYIIANVEGEKIRCKVIVSGYQVKAINLDTKDTTLKPGQDIQLKAETTPSNVTNRKINWSSSNPEVATVTVDGSVRGIKEGIAFITASSNENPAQKAVCKIQVEAAVEFMIDGKSIRFGESLKELTLAFGEPDRIDRTIYEYKYYVYNTKDYNNFFMVGVDNEKVVAFYSDCSDFTIGGFTPSMLPKDINKKYESNIPDGKQSAKIVIGNTCYNLFFDTLGTGQLVGVFGREAKYEIMDGDLLIAEDILRAEEREIFDCCNSARVRNGLAPLLWSDLAAASAMNHSKDMAKRKYFSHNSLDGTTPFQRMEKVGITYQSAAENIIGGHGDAFSSNNGWLNSAGHRKAMLSTSYTYLGVGGAAGTVYNTYFTENFYR